MGYLLSLSDGSAALPAVAWENDLDTGFYRIGANNIAAAANGAKVWEWNETGLTIAAGKTLAIPFSGARVYKSAAVQSIPNSSYTAVTFDAESFDSAAFHDNSTNPSRLTIPAGKAGKYFINAALNYAGAATGGRYAVIYKNGAREIQAEGTNEGSLRTTVAVSAMLDLVATDYIEIYAYQDSGGALNIQNAAYATYAEIHYLGT